MVNEQPLVLAKPVPPGWKHRLYGRQDARRYGGSDLRMRRIRPLPELHLGDIFL